VDTANGPGHPVQVAKGTHTLRADWESKGTALATTSRSVVVAKDAERKCDGDGANDAIDSCRSTANADQSDIDHDGKGDVCDSDMDGDGHSNDKELKYGTDQPDPNDYPPKRR
jgi:thrombospondin type 3 repeat protein